MEQAEFDEMVIQVRLDLGEAFKEVMEEWIGRRKELYGDRSRVLLEGEMASNGNEGAGNSQMAGAIEGQQA